MSHPPVSRMVRVFDWVCVGGYGLIALIGYLQANRLNAGFLTNYGGDVFGTAVFWWGLRRTAFWKLPWGAEIAAVTVFVLCFAWEWCQRFDLSGSLLRITGGVFDGWDLVAYAATLTVCYCLDRSIQKE